jgi:SPP1 gp7 family putative phage head morphogenesis protein
MAAKRRRPRKRQRIPSRAARYALSPQPPRAIELWYALQMKRLLKPWLTKLRSKALAIARRIAKDDSARLDATTPEDALSSLESLGSSVAESKAFTSTLDTVAKRTARHSQAEFARIGIKLREAEPRLDPLITKWRKQNVKLVTRLTKRETSKLAEILAEGEGLRFESLAERITERISITTRKAERIARNETLTLNAQISHERQQAAGVTEYVWTSSGDERVRGRPGGKWADAEPSHWALDGQRFKYDDPPESGTDGERLHPGIAINCRCVAFPIIPLLDD